MELFFWGGTWSNHLNPAILVQKRIIRCMSYARQRDSRELLFENFNILRFQYVHQYFCRLMGQKIVHSNYLNEIFSVVNHGQNTRGAGRNIVKPNTYLSIVQKGFIFQVPDAWNSQYNGDKEIVNIESFKRKAKYILHMEQIS